MKPRYIPHTLFAFSFFSSSLCPALLLCGKRQSECKEVHKLKQNCFTINTFTYLYCLILICLLSRFSKGVLGASLGFGHAMFIYNEQAWFVRLAKQNLNESEYIKRNQKHLQAESHMLWSCHLSKQHKVWKI